MSFTQEAGYLPLSFETLMNLARNGINAQFGTNYTEENFVGTGWYKYLYVPIQLLQQSEVSTAEIFSKLQEYIRLTNEMISRPLVTGPGIIDEFKRHGFIVSVKPPSEDDKGKLFVCVDTDGEAEDYPAKKLEIATILKNVTAGGIVTDGSEVESLTLSNGQSFDYKFSLPNRIPVWLRLTLTISPHNQVSIPSPEDTRLKLYNQVLERYQVGLNFEPQKYFSIEDAPWASTVLLEYSSNEGDTWSSAVFEAEFDDKFEIDLAHITVVES